jgi:hypothetical protein
MKTCLNMPLGELHCTELGPMGRIIEWTINLLLFAIAFGLVGLTYKYRIHLATVAIAVVADQLCTKHSFTLVRKTLKSIWHKFRIIFELVDFFD